MAKRRVARAGTSSSLRPAPPPPSPTSSQFLIVHRRYSKLLGRFYEPLVLLNLIDPVRGEHFESDAMETFDSKSNLRRRFTSALATICDHSKGGDSVTAVALERLVAGTVIWIASNKSPSSQTVPFLEGILQRLKQIVTPDDNRGSLADIMEAITTFCAPRLCVYRRQLCASLPECLKKLRLKCTPLDEDLIEYLDSLQALCVSDIPLTTLIQSCYDKRVMVSRMKAWSKFETEMTQPITEARHNIGRLANYLKIAHTLIDAAFDNDLVGDVQISICPSSEQSIHVFGKATLVQIIHRMSKEPREEDAYLQELTHPVYNDLERRIREVKPFSTRVHAELLLVEEISRRRDRGDSFDFVGGDRFIGCSKPACFCCYHYIYGLKEQFFVERCHNKIYVAWRPPDFTDTQSLQLILDRDHAMNSLVDKLRKEVRRHIDDRPMKRNGRHHDTVTGDKTTIVSSEVDDLDYQLEDLGIDDFEDLEPDILTSGEVAEIIDQARNDSRTDTPQSPYDITPKRSGLLSVLLRRLEPAVPIP